MSLLMINTVLIGYFAKMPLNNRDSGMPMVQGDFVTVFATLYMVTGGHNRPANALYGPPNRSRRRIREIRGFFQVFSFYIRFFFLWIRGCPDWGGNYRQYFSYGRPVTRDFTGDFKNIFLEIFLPRKKTF